MLKGNGMEWMDEWMDGCMDGFLFYFLNAYVVNVRGKGSETSE